MNGDDVDKLGAEIAAQIQALEAIKAAGGVKFDAEKPRMDLLPPKPLAEVADVLTYGAKKYGSYNWKKGMNWSRVMSAAMRHMNAFNDGQNFDDETGRSHIAHAICNLLFLLEYTHTHKELDDRYNNGEIKK